MTNPDVSSRSQDGSGSPALALESLAGFVAALSAARAAPGAGAAGAVALALAAGCASKAFRISAGHHHVGGKTGADALVDAAAAASEVAATALEGAQRDGEDFRAWLGARTSAAVKVLEDDASVVLKAAERLEALIKQHRSEVIASLSGDLAAAEALLGAFRAITCGNLAELTASGDEA
jgi:hypothetical protein